ncbi:unnamed protein product [Rotaria socialis]|uniref:DNA-directed primase/polymerase protein n=1 Tax=Rotaria socialis TaxID=392032 RepID=A0A820Z272_9BILA|nr:unnamed protein product [Rotaria socialis]CAF3391048.1 unnamed protein product [Rotaria socialis]CAF3462735.1 unnamed protein product [Rotaria socialis]CAF4553716.1 unnamed protein product [Rotaria socialis]CAF4564824.1 unnamed protein product [Rotaria socialis]
MTIIKTINRLFPSKILNYQIFHLFDNLPKNINTNDYIFIAIEKNERRREFCYFTMEELIIVYKNSTTIDRNLYEIIVATNPVKAYIDFEYYIDNNLDIQNHYIGSNCCLKLFHYLLNFTHHTHYQNENHIDLALEEFLVLQAINIAEIAHLLVLNRQNKWTLAIDINVYSRNQQFRLFDCAKHGKTNVLLQSTHHPFSKKSDCSYFQTLEKSVISHIKTISYLQLLSFNTNQDQFSFTESGTSALTTKNKIEVLNSINDHLKYYCIFQNKFTPINKSNSLTTISICKNNHNNFEHETAAKFIPFIENIIKSDAHHQGYIYTCIPGKYNKNLLFFNIGGNYRYCPKKGSHHRNNSIAILLDTKKLIYTIRCKDSECNNNILNWISIQ